MSRNSVFLDTAGLVAIWNSDDQWHFPAKRVFAELVRARTRLITTSLILLECGNTAARRPYRQDVIDLRNAMKARQTLIEPTADDLEDAWSAYQRVEVGSAGIVDHVSFVVMRRLGLTQAFTCDVHFRAAGFEALF